MYILPIKMRLIKKVSILTATTGFLMLLAGILSPGWLTFEIDLQKMNDMEMKKAPPEVQMQFERNKNNPNIPKMSTLKMSIGPYYTHYCLNMTLQGHATDLCLTFSAGTIIGFIDLAVKTDTLKGPIKEMVKSIRKNGAENFSLSTVKLMYVAVIIVSSLVLVQSAVSLLLLVLYSCKKYPSKKFGFAGGACMIVSGILNFLFVVVYLAEYSQETKDLSGLDMTGAVQIGMPYSTVLCLLAAILFFVTSGLIIHTTIKSKPQFSYEMMVIDSGKGGNTYIAKT